MVSDQRFLEESGWFLDGTHVTRAQQDAEADVQRPTIKAFAKLRKWKDNKKHGSLNVSIEHHPTIRYMVYNGYYKVMSNIPEMGNLPTPER